MRGHRHPDAIVLEIGNRLQKQLEFSADKVFVGNPRLFCYKLYGVLRTKVFLIASIFGVPLLLIIWGIACTGLKQRYPLVVGEIELPSRYWILQIFPK